jgi:hypothetical protein
MVSYLFPTPGKKPVFHLEGRFPTGFPFPQISVRERGEKE